MSKELKLEGWKMSTFKKHYSLSPRIFRRSLSEQDAGSAALKGYHWYHQMKSKKAAKQMSSDPEEPLGAYRWQTHPWLAWRISKREGSCSLKGECRDPSRARSCASVDAASAGDLQGDPAEMLLQARPRALRAPFSRSLSEPVPDAGSRSSKPLLLAECSPGSQQQGDFIRGFFSSLSSGFSKIMSRKGEPGSQAGGEGKTEEDQIGLSTGKELAYVSLSFCLSNR